MKGEILFEKMTGISEEYITEAALVPAVGASPAKRPENRFAALSRALNSGWGVACICFIVAIAAVVGMVAWGRMGDPVDPFGPGSDPSVRYTFTLESMIFANGQSVDRAAEAGEDLHFSVMVRNHGPAFQIKPYDWDNVRASCVLQGDDSIVLEWSFSYPDGLNEPYWMNMGDQVRIGFHLTIPKTATPGVYDLVLSYGGEQQVYKGVLTVGEIETEGETYPPISTDHVFSFGYKTVDTVVQPGDRTSITCWTVNDDASFTYVGYPNKYAPTTAYLFHRESSLVIRGITDPIEYDGQDTITVMTGEIAGKVSYVFSIPADAPLGKYELVLSFGRNKQSFAGALTVAEPTDVDLDYPLPEDSHPFSFGYESLEGFAIPGDWLTARAWVVNEGEPFSFVGDPYSFQPTATLYHMESGYVIPGYPAPTGVMPRPCNVLTGQSGANSYEFRIPVDAPTGEYGLRLSYHGQEQSFEGVLTVATP